MSSSERSSYRHRNDIRGAEPRCHRWFPRVVRGEEEPLLDIHDLAVTLETIEAVYAAAEAGRRVTVGGMRSDG